MSNARIAEVLPGLNSEWIATDIHLRYDPATQKAGVDFHFQNFLVPQDGSTLPFTQDQWQVLSFDISSLVSRMVGTGVVDPVSSQSLAGLSGGGVYAVFKALADQLYNEDAAAKAALPE